MESLDILEESANYMKGIRKNMGAGIVEIDLIKLDAQSKAEVVTALNNVLNSRIRSIESIVMGVH